MLKKARILSAADVDGPPLSDGSIVAALGTCRSSERATGSGGNTLEESLRLRDLRLAAARLMESDLSQMPGFTIPAQKRTRAKTSAIIASAAHMLQTRAFSEISVDELAAAAGCSTPSIYARFQNKEALLPAIHLLTIEETRARLDAEIVFERFIGGSLESFCEVFIGIIVSYFESNRNFVRAAIFNDVKTVHIQLQKLIPLLTMRINKIIPYLIDRNPEATYPVVDYGIGVVMSMLRDDAVAINNEGSRDCKAISELFATIVKCGLKPGDRGTVSR